MNTDPIFDPTPACAASERDTAPLRLLVDGLDADEHATLDAILKVVASKSLRGWIWAQSTDTDLYLHTRTLRRPGVRAGVSGLLVREHEPAAPAEALALAVPFRVMAVLELLDGAIDRLQQEQLAVQGGVAAAAEAVEDEKTLASSLARLLVRPVEHTLRVRVLGHGTVYLCTRSRTYCMDFEQAQLGKALESKRFVLTAIAPDSPELAAERDRGSPLDELLWPIGLLASREHAARHERHRLRQWPDFARLPHDPRHLQACAALAAGAMDACELAAATGMSETEADHFMHACQLCGVLEVAAVAPAPTPPPQDRATGGLFDRLWRRWMK
ncbi:hypothetical protein ASE35_19560 [Lysobacter sp. Root916]|uniref:hypothetical protein n=1 Tax=Lysobacter sp. Root916 TaxID=1736606 RepID=UPI00070EF0A4|nr:hypothetical protein [Lysobacter sp. Root916]KRD28698.1 hypothetical protein ASE35_19560 [Lysobacter sp. Root916]